MSEDAIFFTVVHELLSLQEKKYIDNEIIKK